jgi:type I restriction enzyme S subunit
MTGRYKSYPEYKNSGVEWLKQLPSDWQTMKVKFLLKDGAEGIKIGPFGSALKLDDMVAKGIRVYGQENVIKRDFTLGKRFISEKKYNEMKVYTANVGDILITMMGTSGKCQVVPLNADLGIIDSHLLKIRTNKKIIPELFRLLVDEVQEVKDQIGKQGKGSIMHGLNSSIVKDLEFPLPSVKEQKNILNFLDHETTKIETLIAKQEKLIELLKEKRQAVISHAVTKGLNPDTPMKDSGVEWLGEVPEHWKISKIRFDFEFDKGLTITKANLVDKGIPCVNYGEIHSKFGFEVDPNVHNLKYVNDEYLKSNNKSLLKKGDIVFADTSEDLEGAGNFTQLTSNERVFAGYHTIITRSVKDSDSRFIAYLFDSIAYRKQIRYAVKGVKVFSITQAILKNTYIWYPNKKTQIQIAKYLDITTNKIDLLIESQTNAIELMKERKIALISAAVTGKIDVRDWQIPMTAEI